MDRVEMEQIIRNERLSAINAITAHIAHEIRNPLGCIKLFASSLEKHGKHGDILEHAESITKCVKTINNIIANVGLLCKPEVKPCLSEIDIHSHLNESLFFTKYVLPDNENIVVQKNFSDAPLCIMGDTELLKQMSMNIILNAVQSIKTKGTIEITTGKNIEYGSGKQFAEIRYADTGSGIQESLLKKVFDPYFTTKDTGQGLGLSIVHNIVDVHNGKVHISKRHTQGTLIRVLLPLSDDQHDQEDYLSQQPKHDHRFLTVEPTKENSLCR